MMYAGWRANTWPGVRNFDFLQIRTCFQMAQPENKGDTISDGAENEIMPIPHPADSDANMIIVNSNLPTHNHSEASDSMRPIEINDCSVN